MLDAIITGTGRCGTHYITDVLRAVGIDARHEIVFGPGGPTPPDAEQRVEVSWLAAPYLDRLADDAHVIHLVRHPVSVVSSLLRWGFFGKPRKPDLWQPYIDYAYECLPEIRVYDNEHARTVAFVVGWNRMIERGLRGKNAARIRIEDGAQVVLHELGVGRVRGIPEHIRHMDDPPIYLDTSRVPAALLRELHQMEVDYGYRHRVDGPMVYWAMLYERTHFWQVVERFAQQCELNARPDFQRLSYQYARTDGTRNQLTRLFLEHATRDDDVLVMLDGDHEHPVDIVQQLVAQPCDVVGATYRMRYPPHNLAVFLEDGQGSIRPASGMTGRRGAVPVAAVGTGAIAIRRRAFRRLMEAGERWPFFRYEYPAALGYSPTEDMYFSQLCGRNGIDIHAHTGIWTDHLKLSKLQEEL